MSAPSTSGLSVELLLRVINVNYGYFTLLYFYFGILMLISRKTSSRKEESIFSLRNTNVSLLIDTYSQGVGCEAGLSQPLKMLPIRCDSKSLCQLSPTSGLHAVEMALPTGEGAKAKPLAP